MVIKIYLSGISASKEVKKRQQRAQFILDSLRVEYENVDITEPGHEEDRQMIKEKCKKRDGPVPLPPQFFNDDQYCGDWFDFDAASDEDNVLVFLKLEDEKQETKTTEGETKSADVQLNSTNCEKREKPEESVEPKDANNELQSNVDSDGKQTVDTSELANDERKEENTVESDKETKDVPIRETADENKSDAELEPLINEKNEETEVISETKKDSNVELNAETDKSDEQMEDVSNNSESKDAKREQTDGNESDVELSSVKEEKTDDIVDDQAYEEVETNKEVTIYEVHNSKKRETNDEKDMEVESEKKEDNEQTGEE